MPTVNYKDGDERYNGAVAALIRAGWGVHARGGGLVVTPYQLKGLAERGLVPPAELERFEREGILKPRKRSK